MSGWPDGVQEVVLNQKQIQRRVSELGSQITQDYEGQTPLFICILRGAVIFNADLIRRVDLKLGVDFIAVSSYGAATESSGEVQLIKDVESSIQGVDVILIDDIIDTGLTINYLIRSLKSRGPASLRICSLLSKPARRLVEVPIDYLGFEIPDRFVVGYGLDYDQRYRNLPFIATLAESSLPQD